MILILVICSMVSTIMSLYYAKSLGLKVGKFFTRYFILFRKNHGHEASLGTESSVKQSLGNGPLLCEYNPLTAPQQGSCRSSLLLLHHGTSRLKSTEGVSRLSLILTLFHEPFPSGKVSHVPTTLLPPPGHIPVCSGLGLILAMSSLLDRKSPLWDAQLHRLHFLTATDQELANSGSQAKSLCRLQTSFYIFKRWPKNPAKTGTKKNM